MANIGGSSGAGYNPGGGGGMDPLTIAAIASSLFGGLFGGSDVQEKQSFRGSAAPQKTLEGFLQALGGLGSRVEQQKPVQLRTTVQRGPEPVRIPGLNFQIGGGLGMDPALDDPMMGMGGGGGLGSVFSNMANGLGQPGQRIGSGTAVNRVAPPSGSQTKQRKPEGF